MAIYCSRGATKMSKEKAIARPHRPGDLATRIIISDTARQQLDALEALDARGADRMLNTINEPRSWKWLGPESCFAATNDGKHRATGEVRAQDRWRIIFVTMVKPHDGATAAKVGIKHDECEDRRKRARNEPNESAEKPEIDESLDVKCMSTHELKQRLADYGATTTGSKKDLQRRLRDLIG
nr:hypothetical protein [Pandoravirus massiliensis]